MEYIKELIVTMLVVSLASCSINDSRRTDYFDFNIEVFTVVEEKDTHDGFLGDGEYYLILDCSEKVEQAKEIIEDWKPLPFTENLQLVMYGGEKNGKYYGYELVEYANWPVINNGVYKFLDRHSETVDPSDDTDLIDRASFNFSVAVYDLDTNTLYYFEYDS